MRRLKKCVLILARGGSKAIPRKNLMVLNGKTLLQHVIDAAKHADLEHIYVSTEDAEIKKHCLELGIDVYDRSVELSTDLTTDYPCIHEFLSNIDKDFDYIVHLRATSPQTTSMIINDAIRYFEKHYDSFDSMRSVIRAQQTPFKMWQLNEENQLFPVVKGSTLHSVPRQILPSVYFQNACIDIIKTATILKKNDIIGDKCLAYVMDDVHNIDIDTFDDLLKLDSRHSAD